MTRELDELHVELLSALKETEQLLTFALLCTTAQLAKDARPFLDRARAAISKAEGRTP